MKKKTRRLTSRERTELFVSILALLTSIVFNSVQLHLAAVADQREDRQQPLSYILEPVERTTVIRSPGAAGNSPVRRIPPT